MSTKLKLPLNDAANFYHFNTILEPVQAGFQTQTETGFVPVIPTGGHKCDVCDGHNRSQSVTLFEIGHSGFQKFFLGKRVWSQSITIRHNLSHPLGDPVLFSGSVWKPLGPK